VFGEPPSSVSGNKSKITSSVRYARVSEHQTKYYFGELKEAKMPSARSLGDLLVFAG